MRTVLGLLGGIGVGKSHVAARILALADAEVVDADRLARAALEAAARDGRLADALGPEVVDADGRPDRPAIAARVFRDADALRRLEHLTHPEVVARVHDRLAAHARGEGPDLLVLDVPLLLETGLDARCGAVWFIEAPDDVRWRRATARGLSADEIRRREAHQLSLEQKRKRADLVIHNEGDVDPQVLAGLERLGIDPLGSSPRAT